MKKSKIKVGLLLILALLTIVFVIDNFKREQFSVQYFTFPENIKPHEKGWIYRAVITVSTTEKGSMFRKSGKSVAIRVFDVNSNKLLDDLQYFDSVSGIEAKVSWNNAESLNVELFERTLNEVNGKYTEELSTKSLHLIKTIEYTIK